MGITTLLVLAVFAALWLSSAALHIYGIVLSFQKKWYIGLASLVVPLFALVIGVAKFFFKKDLLN